jgi:predicted dehydrogenase
MGGEVRVGVIGTGIGVAHIEALQQVGGVRVAAICSAQASRAAAVAGRFAIPRATTDYRDLLGDDIDAIVIATPPVLHLAMGRDAFAAGKHVFCEKPLAARLDEARALCAAARAAGRVRMINYNMRFNAPYARARTLLDEGYLGDLALADARITMNPIDYLRSPNWSDSKSGWFTDAAQGGGILAGSAGPHLVDFLLWFGGAIAEVGGRTAVTRPEVTLADGTVVRDISGEDVFVILARFAGGGMATIRGVPVAYHGGGFSLELHGTRGSLVIERGKLRGATDRDRDLAEIPLPADPPQDRVAIARRFIDAVRANDTASSPTFDAGLAAQAVLEASLTAAREGRWVPVGS